MVEIKSLLKVAAVMLITSSLNTRGQAMQLQEYVLIWNITDGSGRELAVAKFTADDFTKMYSCLCQSNTFLCTIHLNDKDKNATRTTWNGDSITTSAYRTTYVCKVEITDIDGIIYCMRLTNYSTDSFPGKTCTSYTNQCNQCICQMETVNIIPSYFIEDYSINETVNDPAIIHVNQTCKTESTLSTSQKPTEPLPSKFSFTPSTQPSLSLSSPSPQLTTSNYGASVHTVLPSTSSPDVVTTSVSTELPTLTEFTFLSSSELSTFTTNKIIPAKLTTTTSANNTSLTEEEDDNDNLVTIILGAALGVVVIATIIIIIVVIFWRRRKGNPTSAQSRNNRRNRTGDYESPYEMSDVRDNSTENSNSQTPVSVPGPTSYLYATVDLEKKHRNRRGTKKSKGDHVYNNKKVLTTFGKKGHTKSGNSLSHVGDYYNLDPQENDTETPKGSAAANDDKATVGSSKVNIDDNADDYNVVDITSISADANAANNSKDTLSNSNNHNNENSTDDEINRLGNTDETQGTNSQIAEGRVNEQNSAVNDSQSQDTGTEYSGLHETQRHFQNPYNILPDQVPVSETTPTTQASISSSFDIAAGTSTYSLAMPISK